MTPLTSQADWKAIEPGLKKQNALGGTAGPWFQYHDAVGFEWNIFQLTLPTLPPALDGLRIVHLSDLHCQSYWQTAYDDLIEQLRSDPPDLILITGDIVDEIKRPHLCVPTARRLLHSLNAKCGIFGILGNHDIHLNPSSLDGTPLQLIDGQRRLISVRGQTIELIAPQGPERENYTPGFERILPPKSQQIPRIILSHYPDHIRKMKTLDAELFLTGHTHGGQACLPGGIAIQRHDSLPLKMFSGVHRVGKTWMFVNRGFGFSTLPFRLFCPAEVIELRLVSVA